MKIASYKTISAAASQDLDEEVNNLIKQGFQPYGDPYFVPPKSQALMASDISPFNQAMVKFND